MAPLHPPLLLALAVLAASCATPPRPTGAMAAPAVPTRAPREVVETRDTLPAFLLRLGNKTGASPREVQAAWQSYEGAAEELLALAGAQPRDAGDVELARLSKSPDSLVQLVQAFAQRAPAELDAVLQRMATQLGQVPRATVAFAVSRSPRAVFEGELDGKPLVLFNARSSELADPTLRQVAMARALARVLHRALQPDSPSLPPMAARVWREGAILLSARQLVPSAPEPRLLGLTDEQLAKLRAREPLLAQELLAALDSARESELARFFDPRVSDPLLPRGAGPYVSDRLYQKLAAELGSGKAPLQLSPADFAARARRILTAMAAVRAG